MKSVICTLFEGHYHYGVAALVNSLYKKGFRGDIYAGYRGELPKWAAKAEVGVIKGMKGASTLFVAEGVHLHFIPLEIDYHFTNYKPDFMLDLWSGAAKDTDAMFYFDPDIVVTAPWYYFEEWVNCGVALVHEIIANDMPVNHPIRNKWIEIIQDNDETVNNKLSSYVNAGFFGIKKEHIQFVEKFSKIILLAKQKYNVDLKTFNFTNRADPFFSKDQDAFNIAAMCTSVPISEMGPEAMDFIHGGFTMSHAVGTPKPWKKLYIQSALKAIPPSLADKAFWDYTDSPISIFSKSKIKHIKLSIKIASFIGRFYRKY